MRILSLNCWSGRVSGLVEYLKSAKADIYCLQEVLHSPPDTPDKVWFEGQGSTPELQRAKLFSELCAALPGYHAFHLPAAQGYLHDGATTQHLSQYGIATFVGPGIPIIGSASGFVHDEYRKANWNPPPLPRAAHAIRVWDYKRDRPLVVAHMHGMWVPNGKADTPERRDQACKLADIVDAVRKPDDELVVCGDFNVLPGSETISILEQRLDVVDLVGHFDTRTSYYKKSVRSADYMLITNIEKYDFLIPQTPEVSDHRPLLLEL